MIELFKRYEKYCEMMSIDPSKRGFLVWFENMKVRM